MHHYVLMYKGNSLATTARPGRLDSRILIERPAAP